MLSKLCESIVDMVIPMNIRTYSELITFPTFEERFRYLKIGGSVGAETFGYDRWLNQLFYKDPEWLDTRDQVILRDGACDLAMPDREIHSRIIIHHLNPITKEDILQRSRVLFDLENLVCTIKNTHDAIHYSNENLLVTNPVVRTKNDTCPWKR